MIIFNKTEIQAMNPETIQKHHKQAREYERKIRKIIQANRITNTPPGFVPKSE